MQATDVLFEFTEVPKRAYHTSNPIFRSAIAKEGLVPQFFSDKAGTWVLGNGLEVLAENNTPALFALLSDDCNQVYDSCYDDDIYEIDLTKIQNKWFHDPNFTDEGKPCQENRHALTLHPIPLSAIKLIYQGTGKDVGEVYANCTA